MPLPLPLTRMTPLIESIASMTREDIEKLAHDYISFEAHDLTEEERPHFKAYVEAIRHDDERNVAIVGCCVELVKAILIQKIRELQFNHPMLIRSAAFKIGELACVANYADRIPPESLEVMRRWHPLIEHAKIEMPDFMKNFQVPGDEGVNADHS